MNYPQIPLNLDTEAEKTVGENDTAAVYGSGLLPVFATPAMIGFIENTAHLAINPFLGTEFTSVGIHVNVEHLKATKTGMKVRCRVKLIETDGRKLVFEANVWDEEGLIGKGTHTRVIVNKKRFLEKTGI
ncbi:MAG: thioesterase family protein [Sphingobacteriales bacterium]|nr:thioesterase family protein [Sphingobacteriales bacterium]